MTVSERALRAAEFAEQVSGFELMQAQAALISGQQSAGSGAELITLVSPVTGFVLNVLEESARTVAPGTPILEIGDPTDLEAEIELLSSDAVAVRPGDDVSIEQWGGPQPLRGKVVLVEPGGFMKISALGVEEQRVRVRVDFVDPLPTENPLGDRYRVEGRITTWSAPSVVQIPTGALFRRGGEWMTFIFDNGKARLAKVQIGHNSGVAAEVLGGVTPGQQVILHPPGYHHRGGKGENPHRAAVAKNRTPQRKCLMECAGKAQRRRRFRSFDSRFGIEWWLGSIRGCRRHYRSAIAFSI